MGKNVFLFSGQGSQYVGMGKELCDAYPEMKELYDKARSESGMLMPPTGLCLMEVTY